ncbi:hypothetical protein [Solilutibacter silvestris]|uniref:hypothetical protein n=1 Tax=Solilutibacter silvestris TaxID=1645665 RepID=UPI003D348D78
MCDPRTQAERGTGPAARGIDPAVDRAVERAIVPTEPPGVRMPGAGSGEVPTPSAQRLAFEASLRQREQTLNALSTVLRNEAPGALANDARVARAQAGITVGETEFRTIMGRTSTELTSEDRARALVLLNQAYDLGDGQWDNARTTMWRAVYGSTAGGAIVDREIAAGRLRLSSTGRSQGLAPEFLYEPPGGASRWITIDIDHMIPRDRVPFYVFQARNFHLQPAPRNRQWLNRFGAATPFPMGRYADASSDALEEFVQHFRLSRRQRLASERIRRAGAAAAIATLLTIIASGARASTYSELAQSMRLADQQRERQRARDLAADGIDLWNLRSHVERGLAVEPLDIDVNYLGQLLRATTHWVRVDYIDGGGDWERDFTRRFDAASAAHDEDAFNRLLDELGGMLLGGVRGRLDELADIEQLLLGFQTHEQQYRQAADEAAAMAAQSGDGVPRTVADLAETEAAGFAITLEDFMLIVDHLNATANRLRMYIRATSELLGMVRQAHEGDLRRRGRVQDAIEAAAGVHDAAARAGAASR